MTPTMLHVLASAFLSLAPWLVGQALPAGGGAEHRRLVVSLPPGGCMLMIHPDGSGVINYGPAPQTVRVAANSFDFERIVAALGADLLPWSRRAALETEAAGVMLPGSNQSHLNTDTDAIRRLLDQAWQARLPPDVLRFKSEQWDQEWVKRMCGF